MAVEWNKLEPDALPAIVDLAQRCLEVDGGLPVTTTDGFLRQRYQGEGFFAVGAYSNAALVAAGAVRPAPNGPGIVGQVDPRQRGKGLGGALLDRLLSNAQTQQGQVSVETEALTKETEALFGSRQLEQTFAEDVMRLAVNQPLPTAPVPVGLTLTRWSTANHAAFYEAYRVSFSDRPGMPDWNQQQWIDWMVDDEFLSDCSLLAQDASGEPVGFVTCAQAFLIQVGVVPSWRHQGLARAPAIPTLDCMRAAHQSDVFLDVNVNNPASANLFHSLGFTVLARRARFESRALRAR